MIEKLRIVVEPDYLRFDFADVFSVAKAMECVDLMAQACTEQGCRKALLDCRAMPGPMSVTDRFEVAIYAQRLRDLRIRVALVGRPDQIDRPSPVVETVAQNRGVDAMVFEDLEAAIAWLRS